MKALFISWDGPAQNYMESLFMPILGRVQHRDLSIRVLQFIWGDAQMADSIGRAAAGWGLGYDCRGVLRRPVAPATMAMIAKGALDIAALARKHRIDVLFPRSIIPGAMALLARRLVPHVKILFDADGFMADERVDFGGWKATGAIYRLFRDIEAQVSRRSASILTRTHRGKQILLDRAGPSLDADRIHVVPNAKDTVLFCPGTPEKRREARRKLGVSSGCPLVIYTGSLGQQYYPREMLKFFESLRQRRSDAKMVVLTGNREHIDPLLASFDFPAGAITVTRVPPEQVANYAAAADLGLAFRTPSFSQVGVSPIKVAEYLLCGTPVLSTAGIGDLDTQVGGRRVGRLVAKMRDDQLEQAARWFVEEVLPNREAYRERCREVGVGEFGMDSCVERYRRAFRDCLE